MLLQSTRTSSRRGSAYILVLGIAVLVTVLGMAALTVARISIKTSNASNDWDEAGTLAFSAAEQAVSYLNTVAAASPFSWRSGYTSSQIAFTAAMGRGTIQWALKDETDGNLSANYLRPFRIYGIGKVGSVTRVYSVQMTPGGSALDVLRCGVHANGTVLINDPITAANGPISSNGTMNIKGAITGNAEAAAFIGTASATIQTVTPTKTMPLAGTYDLYAANSTPLGLASGSSMKIEKCVLSAGVNPYGAVDANGVYTLSMPANSTLSIQNCRIKGTLLISAAGGGKIQIQGPVLWEPNSSSYPALIVSGSNVQVTFTGNNTWLSENSLNLNFNPASTPYLGASNTTMTDDFPPQYRGLYHIIGSTNTVGCGSNTYFYGALVTDGALATANQFTAVADPNLYTNPPAGYSTGNQLLLVPGSWKWDTTP